MRACVRPCVRASLLACMRTHIGGRQHNTNIYMNARTLDRTHPRTHARTRVRTYARAYARTYVRTYAHTLVGLRTHTQTHTRHIPRHLHIEYSITKTIHFDGMTRLTRFSARHPVLCLPPYLTQYKFSLSVQTTNSLWCHLATRHGGR